MKPANLPISVTLALLMHALVLVLLVWQGASTREIKKVAQQPIIQATMMAKDPAIARRVKAQQASKQRQQQDEAKKREQQRKQDEQKRLEAEQKRLETEQKRLLEARQKEQAEREAAAKKKAAEQQQIEQQKQLQLKRKQEEEQKNKTAAQKQRAEEEAIKRKIDEDRARQAAEQRAQEDKVWQESERVRAAKQAEQAAIDAEAVASMESVMFDMISSQWIRPPGVNSELEATLEVRLLGTGELAINGIKIIKSSGNDAFDRSAVQAIEKAAPFPLLRLEPRQRDKFRQLVFVFTPEDLTQ